MWVAAGAIDEVERLLQRLQAGRASGLGRCADETMVHARQLDELRFHALGLERGEVRARLLDGNGVIAAAMNHEHRGVLGIEVVDRARRGDHVGRALRQRAPEIARGSGAGIVDLEAAEIEYPVPRHDALHAIRYLSSARGRLRCDWSAT